MLHDEGIYPNMTKQPNFLIIVANDLGFSDLGSFSSKIRTPNINRIAQQGMQFTDFHAAAACLYIPYSPQRTQADRQSVPSMP